MSIENFRLDADYLTQERQPEEDRNKALQLTVGNSQLREVVQSLLEQQQARFIVSVGSDRREMTGKYEVTQVFSLDSLGRYVLIRTPIEPAHMVIDSISSLIPGANFSEREIQDLLGIKPEGHPDPRRLILPDDWPDGIHPLRRDFKFDDHPEAVGGQSPEPLPTPEGTMIFPIGPFFPTLEEPAYLNLFVEGERIRGLDMRLFYAHRGIEKLGDSELTYAQIPFIAERICGICGFVHSSCYCQSIENAVGIEVPRRGLLIRTLLLELERIHSHLLWLGLACHFIGFDTLFMQSWRIREPIMWVAEYLTGNRKTYGMNMIGGVSRDIPVDTPERLMPVIDQIEHELGDVVDAILLDSSLRLRLQNSGIITPEDARDCCVVGPTARGSGLPIDARFDHPYAAYPEMDFEICVEDGCDCWARTMVRIREVGQAVKIIRQCLAMLEPGPYCVEVQSIEPETMGLNVVEAPRGEVFHYVLTGHGQRPERWRVRAPSYANLQSVPAMLTGMSIADAPISVGSLDPCFSCTERMEVTDCDSGEIRIFRQKDLVHELRQRG
jgi:formate hydrogenlyase subunit 5